MHFKFLNEYNNIFISFYSSYYTVGVQKKLINLYDTIYQFRFEIMFRFFKYLKKILIHHSATQFQRVSKSINSEKSIDKTIDTVKQSMEDRVQGEEELN